MDNFLLTNYVVLWYTVVVSETNPRAVVVHQMRGRIHKQGVTIMVAIKNTAKLDAKAATLPVEYQGFGRFVVASGSKPGEVYHVQADKNADNTAGWDCTCPWGERVEAGLCSGSCSHVRAAHMWLVDYRAKQERRAARVARTAALVAVPA